MTVLVVVLAVWVALSVVVGLAVGMFLRAGRGLDPDWMYSSDRRWP